MPATIDEAQPDRVKLRGVANGLSGLGLVMLTAATGAMVLGVRAPDWLAIALLAAFSALAIVASGLFIMANRGPFPATRAAKRELLQWNRWQNCLAAWPIVFTNFALLAEYEARRGAFGLIFPLILPLWAFVFLSQ